MSEHNKIAVQCSYKQTHIDSTFYSSDYTLTVQCTVYLNVHSTQILYQNFNIKGPFKSAKREGKFA